MTENKKRTGRGLRYGGGAALLGVTLFAMLALFSYDWRDISLYQTPPNTPPVNLIGPAGAWFSFLLLMGFGVGAYLVPVLCFALAMLLMMEGDERIWPRAAWSIATALALTALLELRTDWLDPLYTKLNLPPAGGLVDQLLVQALLVRFLSPFGAGLLLTVVLVGSLVMLFEARNVAAAWHRAREHWRGSGEAPSAEAPDYARPARAAAEPQPAETQAKGRAVDPTLAAVAERRRRWREQLPAQEPATPSLVQPVRQPVAPVKTRASAPTPVQPPPPARPPKPEPPPKPAEPAPPPAAPAVAVAVASPPAAQTAPAAPAKPARPTPSPARDTAPASPAPAVYHIPPMDLLSHAPADETGLRADTATTSHVLVETLLDFGIEAKVTHVEVGPVVTRYELLPAPGVRVERIAGLTNNIALSLKASSVRVQAPIPGKGVVGIEVPNQIAKLVTLREVLEGAVWREGRAAVPLVLGKDVGGKDLVADLTRMPHLLIAGATGSGKTVCMNSILAGLLMARSPAELRLIIVDPKIVEFAPYNNLPHLVVPVITDPKKVAIGLRWAINEMEKRYKLFAKVGVRNIESYNSREVATQGDLFGASGENEPIPARVPYIVVVIDELADLMLADQAEIENCIARLAQLSRAVGIHMIIATQRPSVNVITGTIKANFPARIAFQVAQKVDSRTILDTAGADKLLGRGDMLFLPPGSSKLIRAQGAMVSDPEIRKVVDFVRGQGTPQYEVEIKEKLEKSAGTSASGDDGDSVDDELLEQSVQIIRETRRASTSSLQRRLRIGYTRAARIMDILEERGVVGPPRGSDPREILIDLDGEIPNNPPTEEGVP